MGVKRVLKWQLPKGSIPSAADGDKIASILEQLACKSMNTRFDNNKILEAKCTLLRQGNVAQEASRLNSKAALKELWLVWTMETADQSFLLLRSDRMSVQRNGACVELEAPLPERSMMHALILERKMEYTTKAVVQFNGRRYRCGDFVVKLQQVGMSTGAGVVFLGHIVELDYQPLGAPALAAPLLDDLVETLRSRSLRNPTGGWLEVLKVPYDDYPDLPSTFSARHTAVMYAELAIAMYATHK